MVLVHVDQSGVLHAPHAQGRSFLHECGYDAVVIPVHTHRGVVALTSAATPNKVTSSKFKPGTPNCLLYSQLGGSGAPGGNSGQVQAASGP